VAARPSGQSSGQREPAQDADPNARLSRRDAQGRLRWIALGMVGGLALVLACLPWPETLALDGLARSLGLSSLRLLSPRWLALAALALVPTLAAWGSLAGLPSRQVVGAAVLRTLAVLAAVVALAQPSTSREVTRTSTVFLVDVSDSVADVSMASAQAMLDEAYAARGDDDVQLVTFAASASRVAPVGDAAPRIARRDEPVPGTRLDGAIELASSLHPPGHHRRIVVMSDGNETEGSALFSALRLGERDIRVHRVLFDEPPPPEVAITGIEAPTSLTVGQPFTLHVGLFATVPSRVRLRVYRDDVLEPSLGAPEREVPAGASDVAVRSVAHVAGAVSYRAEIEVLDATGSEGSAEGDRYPENNRYRTTLVIPGRPSVLYVEGTPSAASYFARALEAGELDVDVRTARAMPTTTRELSRYQFVVLSDTAADEVPSAAMSAIASWVRSGGAFMMAGGERSFGLGGWQGTPIAEILPVRLDGERRRDDASIAIALVIDKSGSMEGEKIELAKEAARATVELLGPSDSIGIIGFDGTPNRIVRMQSAGNRLQIVRDIGRLAAGGGTAIFPALDAAFQDLETVRARFRHVILLTDGNTDEAGIPSLAAAMRAAGITVSTVGIGGDVNRTLLSEIADVGGGRSYFTSDAHNIPRIFVRETTEAMRNSVVEEYFLPRVSSSADFLRGTGLEDAPWLRGYVATRARGAPAQVILTTEGGEPLLARWRVGLGWSLAWTSDVKNRWAADWVRWPGYSRFFSQLVREHMRHRSESELPMRTELDGDEARLIVDALDDDDRFVDGLESVATITSDEPDAERVSLEVPLSQIAPGRYEARTRLPGFGSYAVVIEHRRPGDSGASALVARSTGRIDHPYPREHALFIPSAAVLDALTERSGGGIYRGVEDLHPTDGECIDADVPLRATFLWVALGLFLADLLLRRVRLGA